MRALDEQNGGPRYDTLDGNEPPEITMPATLHAPDAPAEVKLTRSEFLGGMPSEMRWSRKSFLRAKFELVGALAMTPLHKVKLLVFRHSEEHLFGVCYEVGDEGSEHCDVIRYHTDGTSTVVTSLGLPPGRRQERPGHRLIRRPGATAADSLEVMRAESPSSPIAPVSAEEFSTRFQPDYAAESARLVWTESCPSTNRCSDPAAAITAISAAVPLNRGEGWLTSTIDSRDLPGRKAKGLGCIYRKDAPVSG